MFNSCEDFQISLDIHKLNTQITKLCPHQLNNFTNVIKAITVLINSPITAFSLCKTRTLI